jgi:hypothetical protein
MDLFVLYSQRKNAVDGVFSTPGRAIDIVTRRIGHALPPGERLRAVLEVLQTGYTEFEVPGLPDPDFSIFTHTLDYDYGR